MKYMYITLKQRTDGLFSSGNFGSDKIKEIFVYYFDSIKNILKHTIHKNIMCLSVYQSEKDISHVLFKKCIVDKKNIDGLLQQDNNIVSEKKRLINIKEIIVRIKKDNF